MSDLTHESVIIRQIKDSLNGNGETANVIRPYFEKIVLLPDPEYHNVLYVINELTTRCKGLGAVSALELFGKLSDFLARKGKVRP